MTKDELKGKMPAFTRHIRDSVFIYPTDTIYGIGCDATNEELVARVRDAKDRPEQPFSVIAPSKEWIKEHCVLEGEAKKWVEEKLPGPYTLILKMKHSECVANSVNPGFDTLGVRMPDNWFLDVVKELGKPVVTTSANKVGENFMTSLENLDDDVEKKVDFIFYEGEIKGRPSKIVNLAKPETEIIER